MSRGRLAAALAAVVVAVIAVAVVWNGRRAVPPPAPSTAGGADAAAWLDRGDRLRAAGRPYRAVEAYLRAQRMRPDDPEIWRRLGAAALAAQQVGNAELAAERLLALAPGDAAAVSLRAAAQALPTPNGERPGRPRALTRRRCAAAKRMVDRGQLDDAAIVLAAAAWLDEGAAQPQRYLANVAYLQGHIADAVAHQRIAVALAPQSDLLRRNLAALEAQLTPAPGN